MRILVLITFLGLVFSSSASGDQLSFYGQWGTEIQCARQPIKPGGTVLAEPYEISADWLKHGQLWCILSWGPMEHRGDVLFSGAHANCGEDSLRQYFLGMTLADSELTLRWDFPNSTGPLRRCTRINKQLNAE